MEEDRRGWKRRDEDVGGRKRREDKGRGIEYR